VEVEVVVPHAIFLDVACILKSAPPNSSTVKIPDHTVSSLLMTSAYADHSAEASAGVALIQLVYEVALVTMS
tara:strand:+ start:276 stop:491 length:216 start_codon:yes stop_codon:yes gene_type:complete